MVFVSVTRIDVVENYLQQETHSGEGGDWGIRKGGRGKRRKQWGKQRGIRGVWRGKGVNLEKVGEDSWGY